MAIRLPTKLSVPDVAYLLGCAPCNVHILLKTGALRGTQDPRNRRWTIELRDFQALLRVRTGPGPRAPREIRWDVLPETMDIRRVAAELDVSYVRALELVRSGTLHGTKGPDGMWSIRKADLRELVEQRRDDPRSRPSRATQPAPSP